MPLLATTYGGDFYLLFLGWPVLNWAGAVSAAIGASAKRRSVAWLVPALIPIASALWLANNIRRNGLGTIDRWLVVGFLLPAVISLAALVLAVRRRKA